MREFLSTYSWPHNSSSSSLSSDSSTTVMFSLMTSTNDSTVTSDSVTQRWASISFSSCLNIPSTKQQYLLHSMLTNARWFSDRCCSLMGDGANEKYAGIFV